MKTCLDCGATSPPERLWCPACSSTALSLDMPRLIPVCPSCSDRWPSRLVSAKEQGIPVSVLCNEHLREVAAARVQLVTT